MFFYGTKKSNQIVKITLMFIQSLDAAPPELKSLSRRWLKNTGQKLRSSVSTLVFTDKICIFQLIELIKLHERTKKCL